MTEKLTEQVDLETGFEYFPDGRVVVKKFGHFHDHLLFSLPGRHGFFRTYHFKQSGGGMSYHDGDYSVDNFPCQWVNGEGYNPIKENPGNDVPNIDWLSTELFARSRPDSKDFDATRAIAEMKDLPGMLQDIHRSFLNKGVPYTIGKLNLSYKFGWKPLFDDVLKTLTFQDLVKKRFEQLKRQSETGSVIRKVQLYSGTKPHDYEADMDLWKMHVSNLMLDRVWGYTIWKTTGEFPSTDAALQGLAMKSALGLGGQDPLSDYGQTAWNLIPWTWLTDWFLNVGTYLEACRNTDYWTCSVANLCHETIFTANAHSIGNRRESGPHGTVTPLHYERVERRRYAANPPTITAHFPILTGSQVGILGSIMSTKRRS